MLPSLRTIALAIAGLAVLAIVAFLIWATFRTQGPRSTPLELKDLLQPGQEFAGSTSALPTEDPAAKQWVVFYKRQNDNCVYGVAYRAHSYHPGRPQALLPWQLVDDQGNPACLGLQVCDKPDVVEARDILKGFGGSVELGIWGCNGTLPTRLSLFYSSGLTGQPGIADLQYKLYRAFDGNRGIRFRDETTLIVKKAITVGQESLVRNRLCQFEVYEQNNGQYPDDPTKSTVQFVGEEVPGTYPSQPEEVVVAFCLTYHDEGARRRYLDSRADVSFATPGGFGCMGPAAKVEVLRFLSPPSEVGNSATVQIEILIDGQERKSTTWSLRYAEGPAEDAKTAWRWRITSCSGS